VALRTITQNHDYQAAVLITFLGESPQDVLEGLHLQPDERNDVQVLIAQLEAYCIGESCGVFESYKIPPVCPRRRMHQSIP
jgi:hypothetical protein